MKSEKGKWLKNTMILYMSNATAYPIYDGLFKQGIVSSGYQMQKFNSNIITGLGKKEQLTALSALPYANVEHPRIDREIDAVRYIAIKNRTGAAHKPSNLLNLYLEGARVIREHRPRCILCDAIAVSPCYISQVLGRQFHIPVIGIITDLPGMLLSQGRGAEKGIARMRNFDGFVLLTEQMKDVVNPNKKPALVMEGLCADQLPEVYTGAREKTLIYAGSLWKKDAGIEYLVEGFLKANIAGYELHLYGTGELVPWLEEVGKEHPSVRYMGCVTNGEMVALQRRAALLVNPRPSKEAFCKYSFPSKTIEYMASGTPVLMTRLPGVPKEYFDYVYTIEDETPEGVCAALRAVLGQDAEQLSAFGKEARQFVSENKGCTAQCDRLRTLIQEVCS